MKSGKIDLFIIFLFYFSINSIAQSNPPPPGLPDPPDVSIDHEIPALIVCGILLGAFIVRKRNMKISK